VVVFDSLREVLYLVKEELSPWGWRAYAMEFRERMKAEKRLHALNSLPGSGAEPKDGVVQGTTLWQERLDKMLLVEYLKKKLMTAHGEFVEAAELILKSHGWLVKQALLADRFVVSITHVPPAKSERLDLLQAALMKSRQETRDMREAFEDFKLDLRVKRDKYCKRTIENQDKALKRQLQDQATISWAYQAQRSSALRLTQVRRVLESRVLTLECGYTARTEELEESQRQWDEEKEALTADRDKFKKLYNRMVKAHEQAMEDLKKSQGSAEDMAKMIQVLSTEKHRLAAVVEELEEDKRRMAKQLADLRDEVAKMKKEIRRYGGLLRMGEETMARARFENERVEAVSLALEGKLREACRLEASLRDELLASGAEASAAHRRNERGREEFAHEHKLRRGVEDERDRLLENTRKLEFSLVRTLNDARTTVDDVMERARRELETFKNEELAKVRKEFMRKIENLERKNRMLEAEVKIGDEVAPHIGALNPLAVDQSRLCAGCRKAFVFEGVIKDDQD